MAPARSATRPRVALSRMAWWRAGGRIFLAVLVIVAVALLFRSTPRRPAVQTGRPASPLPDSASSPPAAAQPSPGRGDAIPPDPSSPPQPEPEAEPPPNLVADVIVPLSAILPAQVGRFVQDEVTRSPLDESVAETIVIRYRTPDNVIVVYGGAVAFTPEAADRVRKDILNTLRNEQGLTITSHEYGRTQGGDPIVIANGSNSEGSVGVVWSAGRMVHLVRALAAETQDEFLEGLTFWPKADRVKWETDLFGAYRKAVGQARPLVAYFYFETCNQCARLARNVLSTDEMNAVRPEAVFAQIDVEADDEKKNVSRMTQSLGLERYPVVAVLDPGATEIRERGRVVGYYEPAKFFDQLRKLLPDLPPNLVRR